jgi:DNA invertase Pin-like site-specific DNA recombinase
MNKAAKTMSRKELTKAVAYFRTSSATNVGPDKDSLKRQRAAVLTFAKSAGYEIAEEFYDAAVSGADAIDERPGFAAMLQRLLGNGVRTIIVETASRFARDLIVQETGWRFLRNAGVSLVAADSPDSFLDETPTAVLIRQVLGAVAQFEKQALVAKLRKARERKKSETGKCGGRHSVAEAKPETAALAKKLARYPINGCRRSLPEIAAESEAAGHVTSKGTPYGAAAIARMIA